MLNLKDIRFLTPEERAEAAGSATGYVVEWDTDIAFSDPDEAQASGAGVIIERLRAETEYHVRVQGTRDGAFGGVMAGVRFKSMKSPRREAVITGAMSLGALILPAFGLANEFWVIGVALLVLLASIAAIFLAKR